MKQGVFVVMLLQFLYADQMYELTVPNMGCGSCASKIKKAAQSVGEVKGMTMDYTTKDVNLTLEDGTNINEVIVAINNANYKAALKK